MKKSIILSALFLSLAASLFGQISVGVRSGVQFSNISETNLLNEVAPSFDYLISNTSGVAVEFALNDHFAIQPELGFTRKGFAVTESTNINLFNVPLGLGVKAQARFNYLEMPVLFKAKVGSGPVKFYGQAGPMLGYAINGNIATRATGLFNVKLTNTNIDLNAINYNRFEVGAVAGAGVEFDAGFGRFFVDGRYQQGFTKNADIPLVADSFRNRGFSAQIGFLLPLN
jgi:hypothetical protein